MQLRKYFKWLKFWGDWALFQELLTVLRTIANKHSVEGSGALENGRQQTTLSIANVAMRWVLQQQGVTSVIVGARLGKETTRRHLDENAKVFSFELDGQDLEAIRAVQVDVMRARGGRE